MKRNILIFTLIFLLITFIYVLAFPNEPNDFRGIKWGTHISKIKGLQNKEQQGDDVLYTKKNDKLEIAGIYDTFLAIVTHPRLNFLATFGVAPLPLLTPLRTGHILHA